MFNHPEITTMKASFQFAATLTLAASMLTIAPANASRETSLNEFLEPARSVTTATPSCAVRGTCPTKHALVVLMENEGYKLGLPEDVNITTYTCDRFRFDLGQGQNILDAIRRIAGQLVGAAQCLNPANWRATKVPLASYIMALNQFTQVVTDTVLEDIGRATIEKSRAREVYDRVEILEDAEFRKSTIRSRLTELARDYIVDIHVLAHGSTSRIGPRHADSNEHMTARAIEELRTIPNLKLRAVYQQNCFGQFMRDEWMRAGAMVVNGSVHVNYMSFGYASFLNRWLNGERFSQAVNNSLNDWRPFYGRVFNYVDIYTHPSSTTARIQNPLQFSVFGRLTNSDELDASAMVFSGLGDVNVNSNWRTSGNER
jgi:hypothetical protein